MPIYEFYCEDCHRVYKFLSRRIDTEKRPACPRCGRPDLDRQVSLFAVSRGVKEEAGDDLPEGFDEARIERLMEAFARHADRLEDDEDPRQAAQFLRRAYQEAGLPMGRSLEEALKRLEAGEDPDAVDEDLGERIEEEDPLFGGGEGGRPTVRELKRKFLPPEVDDELYEL